MILTFQNSHNSQKENMFQSCDFDFSVKMKPALDPVRDLPARIKIELLGSKRFKVRVHVVLFKDTNKPTGKRNYRQTEATENMTFPRLPLSVILL